MPTAVITRVAITRQKPRDPLSFPGSFEQFVGQKRHDFGEYLALGESHDLIWMRKLAEIRPPGGDSDNPPELALRYACSRANPA